MIYNFNSEERLTDIKLHYNQFKELRDSFSEKRSEYRKLASSLNLNFSSLERSYQDFEKSLLINCYTFMEQLIKNYIYHLLEKGSNKNNYVNNFIDNKINSEKFSPNVKIESIKKILSEELGVNINFLIKIEKYKIEKYNELVKSRNRYAHSGNYDFNFYNFEDVIDVIEYLRFEIFSNINNESNYNKFKLLLKKTRENINKFNKCGNKSRPYLKKIMKEIKKDLPKIFLISENLKINNVKLIKKISEDLSKIKKIDLRSYNKSLQILNSIEL